MKKYNVGIILSISYQVEANNVKEAEEFAWGIAEDDYPELNIEETNFCELVLKKEKNK